jgi:hypothetical protein
MSSQKKKVVQSAEGDVSVVSAEELVQQLRSLNERLPQVAQPLAAAGRRTQLGNVNERFVTAAINAAGATPAVAPLLGSSQDELRAVTDESKRWTAAIDEARVLFANLVTANARRRQKYGLAALQIYQICQQLVRDSADSASRLGPHVAEMKRLNKFGKSRKPQPSTEPTPAPNPPQQTP